MERWGAQGVTLIVSIVLARILSPDIYGTLALVMVFTTLLQVFVDSGLGVALIQKKNADDLDFSSVFWFNITACIILYIVMWFTAPSIASFYNKLEIIQVIRVLSLILIISGVKNIQQAYVSRHLLFKKFFFATLGGTVGAAIIGIWMAYNGFGVWALVAQYLFNALVDTIILWLTVKWRPHFVFSFERFKTLFSFGWKMLVSTLIDTIYNEIRALIIGKFYSGEDLAYYTKGAQFPQYAVSNINASMNSVLLPVLSQKQDNVDAVKAATRRVIRVSSLVIWPLMIGLCAVAENFIIIILTEKWLPIAFFLRTFCLGQALQPLQTTNLSVIKALGRSDLHLKIEVIKKVIAITIVIISSFFGVRMIAIGALFYAIIASFINSFPNKKLINYSYSEQLKDIFPFILPSLIMGCIVYMVGGVGEIIALFDNIIVFILQIVCGVVVYWILCRSFNIPDLDYCINVVKGLRR